MTLDIYRWEALHGETVRVEADDMHPTVGVWEWRGQTGPDFYLVYINWPDGSLIVGTDARNFTDITVLGRWPTSEPMTREEAIERLREANRAR